MGDSWVCLTLSCIKNLESGLKTEQVRYRGLGAQKHVH